jgi:hypothetical protein
VSRRPQSESSVSQPVVPLRRHQELGRNSRKNVKRNECCCGRLFLVLLPVVECCCYVACCCEDDGPVACTGVLFIVQCGQRPAGMMMYFAAASVPYYIIYWDAARVVAAERGRQPPSTRFLKNTHGRDYPILPNIVACLFRGEWQNRWGPRWWCDGEMERKALGEWRMNE